MAITSLRSGDDPPFTVVRVTGADAEGQLRAWLTENPVTGTLELELDDAIRMRRSAVKSIADDFGLQIRKRGEGGERVALS